MRPVTDEIIVRASRFELIDAANRVRAVLGMGPASDTGDDDIVGLELFDRAGDASAWLLDTGDGSAQLTLAVGGNQVVIIQAASPSVELIGGSSISLCDLSGRPVLEWIVDPDREVELRNA